MSKSTRMLAVAGMAIAAGAMFGISPAMATGTTTQGAATSTQAATQARPADRVVGYYSSRRSCERAGRIGEAIGRWDDYDCSRAHGRRHGWWELEVSWDRHHRGDNNNNNDNNNWHRWN
jgi:hypothetical protein